MKNSPPTRSSRIVVGPYDSAREPVEGDSSGLTARPAPKASPGRKRCGLPRTASASFRTFTSLRSRLIPPKEKATGAAVIVAPGGGHRELWTDHEGHNVARYLSARGVAAFVLKYRLAREANSTTPWTITRWPTCGGPSVSCAARRSGTSIRRASGDGLFGRRKLAALAEHGLRRR